MGVNKEREDTLSFYALFLLFKSGMQPAALNKEAIANDGRRFMKVSLTLPLLGSRTIAWCEAGQVTPWPVFMQALLLSRYTVGLLNALNKIETGFFIGEDN